MLKSGHRNWLEGSLTLDNDQLSLKLETENKRVKNDLPLIFLEWHQRFTCKYCHRRKSQISKSKIDSFVVPCRETNYYRKNFFSPYTIRSTICVRTLSLQKMVYDWKKVIQTAKSYGKKQFNQNTYYEINYSESCKRRNKHNNVKCAEKTINEEQRKNGL